MRILDSKDEGDRKIVADAPTIGAHLTDAAQDFYAALKANLARFGIAFVENPRIVRGLDYYSHTAFEFVTTTLGAQGTVMAGGRYDGLVAEMGGPPTPRSAGRRGSSGCPCCSTRHRKRRARWRWCRWAMRRKRRLWACCNRCGMPGFRRKWPIAAI